MLSEIQAEYPYWLSSFGKYLIVHHSICIFLFRSGAKIYFPTVLVERDRIQDFGPYSFERDQIQDFGPYTFESDHIQYFGLHTK